MIKVWIANFFQKSYQGSVVMRRQGRRPAQKDRYKRKSAKIISDN